MKNYWIQECKKKKKKNKVLQYIFYRDASNIESQYQMND